MPQFYPPDRKTNCAINYAKISFVALLTSFRFDKKSLFEEYTFSGLHVCSAREMGPMHHTGCTVKLHNTCMQSDQILFFCLLLCASQNVSENKIHHENKTPYDKTSGLQYRHKYNVHTVLTE